MDNRKKERYIILVDDIMEAKATSIKNVAELVGCTRAHIYKTIDETGSFKYKKTIYKIIDRLG